MAGKPGFRSSEACSVKKCHGLARGYLQMFIVPYPLNVLYPVKFVSEGVILRAAAAAIALVVVLFIVWFQRKKQPLVFLAGAWYFLSLLPVLNIFPTVPVVADRYAYLAVFGVGLILAIVLRRACQKKKILLFTGLVIIAAWSYIDFNRNMDWRSDLTLFEREISVNPDVDRIYIVEALWVAGRYEEALSYMKEEKGKTGTFRYDQYQGRYLFKLGRYSDAIAHYKEALARGGSALKEVHLDIAMAYEKEGMDTQALEEYLKTIETDSLDVLEKYNRKAREGAGRVRGRLTQGLEEARNQALNDPLNFQYQATLALSLHRLGLYEEAEKFYDRALKLNPLSWEAWYNLGLARMKQRRHAEAIQSFEKSLLINPGNKDAFNNAGTCYMSLRNYSQAIKCYESALALDPNFFYASFNLGRVYFNAGNREMSRKYFSLAKTLAGENSGAQTMVDQYLRHIR